MAITSCRSPYKSIRHLDGQKLYTVPPVLWTMLSGTTKSSITLGVSLHLTEVVPRFPMDHQRRMSAHNVAKCVWCRVVLPNCSASHIHIRCFELSVGQRD